MVRLSLVVGSLLAFIACAGVRESYVSVPSVGGQTENPDQADVITLEGLTMVLRPHNVLVTRDGTLLTLPLPPAKIGGKVSEDERLFNSSWYPEPNPSYFFVEVAFISETNGYRFDPLGTTLSLEDGRQLQPQSSFGPFIARVGWKKEVPFFLCEVWPEDRVLEESLEIHDDAQTCIALRFDVPPPLPGEAFAIQLSELTYEGTAVALPSIEYKATKHVSSVYQ